MIQFDKHIFQKGWNHQPDSEAEVNLYILRWLLKIWIFSNIFLYLGEIHRLQICPYIFPNDLNIGVSPGALAAGGVEVSTNGSVNRWRSWFVTQERGRSTSRKLKSQIFKWGESQVTKIYQNMMEKMYGNSELYRKR